MGQPLVTIKAMKKGLRIANSFGQRTVLAIERMEGARTEDASLPDTFAAPRLAMLVAFVDQIPKVQALRRAGNTQDNRNKAAELSTRASRISRYVDETVSGASPELFVFRLAHAWSIVKRHWSLEEDTESEPRTPPDLHGRHDSGQVSILALSGCPSSLKKTLAPMFNALKDKGPKTLNTNLSR